MPVEEREEREVVPKKKKSSEDDDKRNENITPGSLMKAIIRSGEGTGQPSEGDQVRFHSTTRTLDEVIVHSARSEHGDKGYPIRYVLGKSKMILEFSEGIPSMLKGEVAMFKMKPEIHYAEVGCPVAAPEAFPKHDELHFEIEMLDFFKIKVPEGLVMCVRLMLPGEISIVTCPPDYAYDKFERLAHVPEGAHVQWEIELLGFEMP